MENKKKGKILAVLLSGAIIGTQIPGMTVAEGAAGYTGGICEHHPVHTAECGYQEAVSEQPCRHEHTKECYEYVTSCVHVHTEECYPLIAIEVPAGDQDTEGTTEDAGTAETELVRGPEPTACAHVCGEDSGCVTKTLNCIHEDKVNADGSITYAVHDASCGYAPAVEGKECTFVCEICSAQSLSETETEALTVQTGIAAAEGADSEPSATTTEAGDEGTDEDETDSETETSTEEMTGAGPEGTAAETDSETEAPAEKTTETGTEGTSAGEIDSETKESTEKTTEAGTEGTDEDETDSETETSTEKTMEVGTEGTDEDETDSETETSTEETSDSDAETKTDEVAPDEAVISVQAMIDALPSVEEVEKMTPDERKKVYDDAQDAADAYFDELTEEQQAQVDLAKLMDLMNYFNGQVSMMASSGMGWMLSDDGVLTITSGEGLTSISAIRESYRDSIKSIIIEKDVGGSIADRAFWECGNLTSVTVKEGAKITSIGVSAFYGCSSLTEITIPDSVTSIGASAFHECSSLTEITIPDSVTSIGTGAFFRCRSLTEITIPGSVTSIEGDAFRECSSLTEITIPGSVTSIGVRAFYGCSSLTEITIPDGVTSIGNYAFYYCGSLTKVTLPATAPISVTDKAFFGKWGDINFIIPADSIGSGEGKYNLNESPWNQIKMVNRMQVDNGKCVIESVTINLSAPQAGENLPSANSDTDGVSVSSSWNPNDTVAKGEITYTVTVTLSVQSENYKFADSVAVTFNNEKVEDEDITEKDGTLIFTQTYQIPKQSQNSPVISIDYQNEKLNTTADMEYRTNEEETWTTCAADMTVAALGWNGTAKTVQIRMQETANAYASDPASVTIPARPAITVSQTTGSTTASSLTVSASVSGTPEGVSPEVQYQLVADGGSIDSEKWQDSGAFTNLKAGTGYTAYAKCDATESSFASDISSGQTVSTAAAAYTVTIPSEVIAGDSTSKGKAEISVNTSKSFDLGYNGQVQVKVQSGGAVSSYGSLTLTRQDASDTLTSAMYVDGNAFTDITKPVMTFTMDNYNLETAKAEVSFAEPKTTDTTQTVIPAGTYSGTVFFEVTYSEQGGGTE